jgi:hypothetical protein
MFGAQVNACYSPRRWFNLAVARRMRVGHARQLKRGYAMLRKSILIAASVFSIGVVSAPALAKDTDKGKWPQDKAQGYCNSKEGSTSWASPDGMQYGCAYKGGGGLLCDKEAGCLENDGKPEKREPPLGLAGLLGLIGLLGLTAARRRDAAPVR